MPSLPQVATRIIDNLQRRLAIGATFGPLLIDRGRGLLYDVERDITWLQDANYAKTVRRSPDGQLTWHDAMAWAKGINYRGITGWRLPSALNADGSGPCEGENCRNSEIGHLFFVASKRMSPPDLRLGNFEPFSIYWLSTEASATQAFAFKMTGLRQGRLDKNPWVTLDGHPMPLPDKVLAWPVHDGDVGTSLFARLLRPALDLFRFSPT